MLRDIIKSGGHDQIVSCPPDAKIAEVAKTMAERNVGAVMVLSNDKPRGIITDRDIVVRCVAMNVDVNDTTVENILSEELAVCQDTDGIFDCIEKMKQAKVRRMPVVDKQGKAVGIISFGDLFAVLSKEFSELAEGISPAAEDRQSGMLRAA